MVWEFQIKLYISIKLRNNSDFMATRCASKFTVHLQTSYSFYFHPRLLFYHSFFRFCFGHSFICKLVFNRLFCFFLLKNSFNANVEKERWQKHKRFELHLELCANFSACRVALFDNTFIKKFLALLKKNQITNQPLRLSVYLKFDQIVARYVYTLR